MKQRWIHREIDAPADVLWELLADPEMWPTWGPSVRRATIDGDALAAGTRGTVTTSFGVALPFEITAWEPGVRWAWKVARIGATDHTVESLGPNRCRVGFGVPWPAAAYLAVCRVALGRLDTQAMIEQASR